MAKYKFQGSTFTITDGTTPTTVHRTVGGFRGFQGFDGVASDIDITQSSSTSMEYRQGLMDQGSVTLDLFRDPADLGQIELQDARAAGAIRQCKWVLVGGRTATFNAYVKSFSLTGSVDNVVTASAKLKITGDVTWT